jgi:3-deoxy-D-manno-octulosonic-acid transferase
VINSFDLAYLAAAPVVLPLYMARLWRARRPLTPLWERLRGPFAEPGTGPRIWVHGVSVGEVLASRTLVAALGDGLPGCEVLVSASTETGRAVAVQTYGEGRSFPCPLDLSPVVRRAFDSVRPRLLVLMELEVWPNLVAEAVRRRVPVAVVNGRITDRSARGYARLRPLLSGTFGRLDLCAVQTAAYACRPGASGSPAR